MKIAVREFRILPADIYEAKFIKAEEITTAFGDAAKLFFEIRDGDYDGETVSALATISEFGLTPRCKLRAWIEAMMGHKLDDDTREVDLDNLAGMRCRLNIIVTEKDGAQWNKVESVLPASKRTTNGLAAAAKGPALPPKNPAQASTQARFDNTPAPAEGEPF